MTLITECAIHPYNHTRFLHTTHQLRNMTFSASQHEEKNFDYLMKSWLAEERKKGRNQIVSCDKNFVTRYAFAFKTGHSRKKCDVKLMKHLYQGTRRRQSNFKEAIQVKKLMCLVVKSMAQTLFHSRPLKNHGHKCFITERKQ